MAKPDDAPPTSVLDASALLAFMHDEDGKSVVAAALAGRAVISVANWAEVLEGMTEADCVQIARLRPLTVKQGLSLADRACLVLATRLKVPALTTDRASADAEVDAEVQLIR